MKEQPKTENFGHPDLEAERVVEQREGSRTCRTPKTSA
jgi:hypothetical protein